MRRIIASSLTALLMGGAGTAFANGPSSFPSALPPVANPGECYAQVKIPAQYATGSQTVVTSEAYTRLEVTDAQFQSRREGVLTKEPSVRYVVRQPTYRTVTEQVLTRPAHERLSVSQPQFSTVTENLQTGAPHLVWKRGNPGELQRQGYIIHSTADGRFTSSGASGSYGGGSHQGGTYATTQNGGDRCGPGCEIWCLVEEPGTSVSTTRRVMSTPPRVTRTPVPAEYTAVRKEVVSDPGGVQEIPVEAEYASVEIHDLVQHAATREVYVPEQLGQVSTKDLISPESYEWRRVLCQPGTGTIRSGASFQSGYQSGTHGTSGTTYSSGSTYSGGSIYSGGSSSSSGYSRTPTYSGQSYGTPSSGISSGSLETGQNTQRGTVFRRRAPHRRRRF